MNIKEIMSKNIITCSKDESLLKASNLMKKNDIGFLPISDNKKIIGVITDRDIVIKALSNKEDYSNPINDYINKNIITIDVNSNIQDTLKTMGDNKIKRLIVKENNKVVGIISLSDIINSKYNESSLFDTLKSIYTITDKNNNETIEIDEFYL